MTTSRERALAAPNHIEPDRVPLDFGGWNTTLHLHAHEALMKYLGLKGPTPRLRNYHTYVVEPDPQLFDRFEGVSELFFPKPAATYTFSIDPKTNTYVDEWGTRYYMPPDGYIITQYYHPRESRGRAHGPHDNDPTSGPSATPGAKFLLHPGQVPRIAHGLEFRCPHRADIFALVSYYRALSITNPPARVAGEVVACSPATAPDGTWQQTLCSERARACRRR